MNRIVLLANATVILRLLWYDLSICLCLMPIMPIYKINVKIVNDAQSYLKEYCEYSACLIFIVYLSSDFQIIKLRALAVYVI